MVQLQNDQEKFTDAGIQIVGLSYDSVDTLKKFTSLKSITFPLLSDEGSQTIQALDLEYKKGLPHPGILLIDTPGVIQGKLFKDGFKSRHTNKDILAEVQRLKAKLQQAKRQPASPTAKPELVPAN